MRLPATTLLYFVLNLSICIQAVVITNLDLASITAGKPFTITWSIPEGSVSIALYGPAPGALVTNPSNLSPIFTIDSGLMGTSYIWNVPASITQASYALKITDFDTTNYSTLFEIADALPADSTTARQSTSSSVTSSSTTPTPTSSSTSTSQQSSSSTPSSTSTSSATPSASQTPPTQPSSGGLSSGSKAGIGIGAASGFLLIIVAIFFAFRCGKKIANSDKRKRDTGDVEGAAELSGDKDGKEQEKVELGDTGLLEAEDNNKPLSEEEKKKRASELEGKPWVRPVEIG